jgi:predicted transcriptional regulator
MLRLEQEQVAAEAGVSAATISRLEGLDGEMDARASTLRRIQRAFEALGIEFLDEGKPGVRMNPSRMRKPTAA